MHVIRILTRQLKDSTFAPLHMKDILHRAGFRTRSFTHRELEDSQERKR